MNTDFRSALPHGRAYFERELGPLSRPDRKGWMKARCPFHNSRSGKSFSAHVDGHFYCHGCGAKGPDIINFVRQRYGLSFPDALKHLGIENGSFPCPARKSQPKSAARLLAEAVVNGPEPTEIQVLRQIFAEANERLITLRRGAAEAYDGEQEHCLEILALALEDLRLLGEVDR
jgi:CHC2 zinc finger